MLNRAIVVLHYLCIPTTMFQVSCIHATDVTPFNDTRH
jgi:hypothetical protein